MSEKKIHNLKLTDYEIGDTIKILPLGRVKIAKSKRTNELVALKILIKSKIIESKLTTHIFNELNILSNFEHPSIVSFLGSTHDDKYLYLFLEFVPGGDMFTLLKAENKFSLDKAQFYAGQIVFVLDYLHSKNIVYRNLKPENILINKNGYIKITDFELSKEINVTDYMDDFVIIHEDKEYLKSCLEKIKQELANKYKLDLNIKKSSINSIKNGIDCLGFNFYVKNSKVIMKVRNRTKKKFKKKMKEIYFMRNSQTFLSINYDLILSSYKGHLKWGSCQNLINKNIYNS